MGGNGGADPARGGRLEQRGARQGLKAHEIAAARRLVRRYRESFLQMMNRKKVRRTANGQIVFTVLTPPLGSPVARRRVRQSIRDFVAPGTEIEKGKVVVWGRRLPHVLSVAVTYDCPCRCKHCSANPYRQKTAREGGMLSFDELVDVIAQGVDAGATLVILTGGEPLTRPDLFDLIGRIDHSRCISVLFTNGEYLTDETVRRLKEAGLFGLFVSIDSAVPAEHDAWRHRPGLFEKAVAGVRGAVQAGLLTGLSTVATRRAVREEGLVRVMGLARDLGVIEVIVFDLTPAGKLAEARDRLLEDADRETIQRLMMRCNASDDYPNLLHESIFSYFAMPSVQGCPGASVLFHVRGNGDVSACDGMPIPFGNVRTEPLRSLWERMTSHRAFARQHDGCRLADPEFVAHYIRGRKTFE